MKQLAAARRRRGRRSEAGWGVLLPRKRQSRTCHSCV